MILLATQPLLRMTCPSIKIPLKYCTLTCTSLMNFSCPASCNSNNYIVSVNGVLGSADVYCQPVGTNTSRSQ
jgi:hypothetical protein